MPAADAVIRLRHALPANLLRAAWFTWIIAGIVFVIGTAWALTYSASQLPAPGMQARVYRGADFGGVPTVLDRDHALDPVQTARVSGLDPQQSFSVEWQGVAVATEAGIHHLRVRVDDGVAVWLDDQLLIERFAPGRHDLSAAVRLTRGLHRLRVRYAQLGGDALFRLSWARPSWREHFVPVLVVPPAAELIFRRVDKALSYPIVVAVAWSLWILSGLALAFCASCAHMTRQSLAGSSKAALALAIVAVILFGFGIELGAAPWRDWVPDELTPNDFLFAAQERFAGGWFFLYPPFHFYLVNIVTSPFLLLAPGGWLDIGDYHTLAVVHVVGRTVSVVMGVLTLLVVALIAGMTIGRRLTLLAPFFLLGAPAFVFYSKTTNVDIPYVFWVSVAMLLFLRAVTTRALADHVLLGAAVALAVATKDQAYGFFPGAAAILVWLSWTDTRHLSALPARARATFADRRLWAGAATCLVVYVLVMGVSWNVKGVIAHFELMNKAAPAFRMFPPTLGGMSRLAGATALVFPSALGPLCTVFGAVGLCVVVLRPRRYRRLLLLLGLAASYLVSFVAVAGYIYDRFLLGIGLVAVLLAAVGFDTAMRAISIPRARLTVSTGLLLMVLWPSFLVNLRIASDSRLELEEWMEAHIERDLYVVGSGAQMYLPNLHPFRHMIEPRRDGESFLEWNPDVIVLNAQWVNRYERSNLAVVAHSLEQAGYQRVYSAGRDPEPPWWSTLIDVGAPADLFSNLDKINPPLSVWRRP
ncbi:MAG TPA: PA14 domain-containing protein [Vicinamibacterales bacterium]|nr:PA14 domain-containing protein [Vicinamibacterales bacterium]